MDFDFKTANSNQFSQMRNDSQQKKSKSLLRKKQ
jgi:hypothetical protein